VEAAGADFATWQQFPQNIFITFNAAAAFALAQAQKAIDAELGPPDSEGQDGPKGCVKWHT
jgi:hypothetical protein